MEFTNEKLETRFTLPDKPTYRAMLAYDSARDTSRGLPFYEMLWHAANEVIEDWECPHLDRGVDLESAEIANDAVYVIEWVGLTVHSWRFDFDDLPKNS